MRHLMILLMLALLPAAASIAQPADDISVPPIEAGVALTYAFHDSIPTASDPVGGVLALNGNVSRMFGVTGEAAFAGHGRSLAAGPRVSTGFYREANGVGRFFAEAVIGRADRAGQAATMMQVGAGADVLVAPRGLSLHWALDYWLTPRASIDRNGARFSVGVVFGPRPAAGSGSHGAH